jgi:hypothetical protein
MAKPRLTLDQHRRLGRLLADLRDELQHHAVTLNNAYPTSGPDAFPAAKLTAAYKAIDEARSALDSALFREHPAGATPTAYYPPRQRPGSDCPATGTVDVIGDPIVVICNLEPHGDGQHHDNVHGDWTASES